MENERNACIPRTIVTPITLESDPFILIDRMQWAKEYAEGAFDDLYPVSLVPEGMEADKDKLPLLVNMATVDDDVKNRWAEMLKESSSSQSPFPLAMLLQMDRSQHDTEYLKTHLIQQLIQRDRQANLKYLLRYYDSRVLSHIQRIMRPGQMRYLLEPITRWDYYLRGTWHTITIPTIAPAPLLLINNNQWDRIKRVGEINRVISHLPAIDQQSAFDALAQKIEALLVKAQSLYHLANPEDRVAFAMHGMTINERFDTHPLMQEVFSRLEKDAASSYQYEVTSITEENWETIKQWKNQGLVTFNINPISDGVS